jgi:excisionase family DNA binding protein
MAARKSPNSREYYSSRADIRNGSAEVRLDAISDARQLRHRSPSQDPRAYGLVKAAYSVKETLELLSIGRTKFYELVDAGDLKITKLGTKSLVYVTEIVALLAKLQETQAEQ